MVEILAPLAQLAVTLGSGGVIVLGVLGLGLLGAMVWVASS